MQTPNDGCQWKRTTAELPRCRTDGAMKPSQGCRTWIKLCSPRSARSAGWVLFVCRYMHGADSFLRDKNASAPIPIPSISSIPGSGVVTGVLISIW